MAGAVLRMKVLYKVQVQCFDLTFVLKIRPNAKPQTNSGNFMTTITDIQNIIENYKTGHPPEFL
jgi:hypothetical protein